MNHDLETRLQAHLDGELSEREATKVSALLESDAGARALYAELSHTRQMLVGNEPEVRLPESREFYWSKIEREIRRLESAPVAPAAPGWLSFLKRHVAAVSGVGVATALLVVAAFQMTWVAPDLLEEIDNPLGDSSSFSFRSESQRMTVVWISNPSVSEEEADLWDEAFQ